MPEFLGITKPVPGARGEVLPTLVAGQVCRWGSPSIRGGHHGFERDRLLTALSLNRPALRGPPARPEAPKKPAMLGQEHRQLSSDGEGTAVSRALAILGTASPPAMMEASPGPKGAHSNAGAGPQRASTVLSLEAERLGPGGWAVPSVLRERQGQGGLEGGFLIDAIVLEDRKWRWAGGQEGPDKPSCVSGLSGPLPLSAHSKQNSTTTSNPPPPLSMTQAQTEALHSHEVIRVCGNSSVEG